MKQKNRWSVRWCMAVLTLVLLLGTAVVNIPVISGAFERLFNGTSNFSAFTQEIRNAYTGGITSKEALLNINGLFARLMGRRVYNGVVVLNNGMLTWDHHPKMNVEKLVEHTAAFSKELEEHGIEFLYVQAVQKPDQANTLLPEGVENYGNIGARQAVGGLRQAGVPVLDMAPYLNQTVEMVEKNFYNTDHHWKYEAAFECYQMIAQHLQGRLPHKVVDMQPTLWENWKPHTLEKVFMGSQARRVGRWFGGLDDLTWYTPKFDTDLMWVEPYDDDYQSGSFEEANIDFNEVQADSQSNSYAMLGGGDRNLLVRYNPHAPNDLHIVLVKDSFANPTAAFLSTFCRRIDIIDPRLLPDSISRYIDFAKPDAVIWLINSTGLQSADFYPPTEVFAKADTDSGRIVVDGKDVHLPEGGAQTIAEVTGSQMCRLSMEGIHFEQESLPLVEIELSTDEGGFPIFSQLIEPDQEPLEWLFPMPDNEFTYDVVLRAGYAHGRTVPLTFEGVTLEVYDIQE